MNDVERQLIVRQRMQERLQEADNERMARMARTAREKRVGGPDARPWQRRIAIAIVRRLSRVAQAS